MKHSCLIVVDMQKDFVDGALGTAEAQAIVPAVLEKIKNFDGTVFYTQDTHEADYLSTQEGKHLPVEHCIQNSAGWELIPQIKELREQSDAPIFQKNTFGSTELARTLREIHGKTPLDSIELIGLCTDICVVSNALMLKAFMPDVPMQVDAACCAGVTPSAHQAALQTMKSCQIAILHESPATP
ncbi:MAG: isochorismatase family cysteine hydrolase [Eubacteriales bacterium]|nr:isochorismatase family cysteine hydrolase [Eubacteriales bacterium]